MNYFSILLIVGHLYLDSSLVSGVLYEITVNSFEPDPNIDAAFLTMGTVRVTRKNRNRFAITGDFELNQNWGDENEVSFDIKSRNGKGPSIYGGKASFCEFLNMENSIIDAFRKASNLPPVGTCPLLKGKYAINEFEVQEEDLPPVMVKDQYVVSARMTGSNGKQVVAYKIKLSVK
ncbi:uncharacterized protein LOC131685775 [Topomyia yanbarensis]|uniref:uncharacterized protein LOC131685775 n=1 Tax=Topomyia yanbarensis TaxID=2498891 RepID=UPI00273BB94B|nr:uncharacterized protein LOC131685775 [Topomyia yanbarensis]